MHICILIIGAIRNDFTLINNIIENNKKQFSFAKITTILCTWEPTDKIFGNKYISNYYYNYSKDDFIKQVCCNVDISIFMENPELDKVQNLKNGSPPCLYYQISYLQKYLRDNNLIFDYIVKTRNDIDILLKYPNMYFNNNTYIPPAYWLGSIHNNFLNDHFFIMPYNKFIDLNLNSDYIIQRTKESRDCEELNNKLITPTALIPNVEIIYYKTYGGCKINVIN